MKKNRQVHARLTEALFNRLNTLSERTRYTSPQLIEMCLEGYLPTLEERLPDVGTLLPAPAPALEPKKRRAA